MLCLSEFVGDEVGEFVVDGGGAFLDGGSSGEGFGGEDAGEGAVFGEDVEECGECGFGAGDGVVAGVVHGASDASTEQGGGLSDDGGEEGFFVGEVEVESAFGGLGFAGDFVHLGLCVAAFGEDLGGGAEEGFASFDGAGLLWRALFGGFAFGFGWRLLGSGD